MNKNSWPFDFDQGFMNEYISEMKSMIKEFKNDFGTQTYSDLGQSHLNKKPYLPIEVRETFNQIIVCVLMFSSCQSQDTKLEIMDKRNIKIKVDMPKSTKSNHGNIVYSDFPDCLEREVHLSQPIKTDEINKIYSNGILNLVFTKDIPDFDLPIDI